MATEHLSVLWVVHDEFAEWMMTEEYKDTVTNVVSRLGVKARAAGIFLVFAAQRPDSLVMPMQLRANLGNRLILRVDSEGTSEIALGEPGAENLLGKGHLAAKLGGESGTITAQVPFVSSAKIFLVFAAQRPDSLVMPMQLKKLSREFNRKKLTQPTYENRLRRQQRYNLCHT